MESMSVGSKIVGILMKIDEIMKNVLQNISLDFYGHSLLFELYFRLSLSK